jgi:hypothetical protein
VFLDLKGMDCILGYGLSFEEMGISLMPAMAHG